MLEADRLSIAAHLHNLLRRKLGRVTDIEWMTRNNEYAREIVRLALSQPEHTDLVALGQRLQALLPPVAGGGPGLPTAAGPGGAAAPRIAEPPARYVRSLR